MSRWWANVAAGLLVTTVATAAPAAALASATLTSTTPDDAAIESRPLRPEHSTSAAGRGTQPSGLGQAAGDLWHVAAGLGCVIGLALGLRWAAQRLALVPAVGTRGGNGRGVRVVSRTVIGPKQQVLVIQVGRRLVVVGDGGAAGLRPLAEITDPDEVAAVIGEARVAESAAGRPPKASPFGRLFRRAAEPYEAMAGNTSPDNLPPESPPAAELPGEVAGLLDRVRGMRQQFQR